MCKCINLARFGTASWLSEDPMGDVDSPNLYAAFGWAPHFYTDPMGNVLPKKALWDPETPLYKYDGEWYQVNRDQIVYRVHLDDDARHTMVRDPAVAKAVRRLAGIDTSIVSNTATLKLFQTMSETADYDALMAMTYAYWGAAATPFVGGARALPHLLGIVGGTVGASGANVSNPDEVVVEFYKNYWLTAVFARVPLERIVKVRIPHLENYEHAIRMFSSGFLANIATQLVENYQRGNLSLKEMEFDIQRAMINGIAAMEGGVVIRGSSASKEALAEVLGGVAQTLMDYLYGKSDFSETNQQPSTLEPTTSTLLVPYQDTDRR